MEMSHHGFFLKFSELKYERKRVHFSPYDFFFIISIYTYSAWERKMYSLALIYSKGCKCSGGGKCLWECELTKGPLPWVLFYIQLMWNICAMQVMLHESTDNTEDIV